MRPDLLSSMRIHGAWNPPEVGCGENEYGAFIHVWWSDVMKCSGIAASSRIGVAHVAVPMRGPRMLDPPGCLGCSLEPGVCWPRDVLGQPTRPLRVAPRPSHSIDMDVSATACAVYPLEAAYARRWAEQYQRPGAVAAFTHERMLGALAAQTSLFRGCMHCVSCCSNKQRQRGQQPGR